MCGLLRFSQVRFDPVGKGNNLGKDVMARYSPFRSGSARLGPVWYGKDVSVWLAKVRLVPVGLCLVGYCWVR